MIPCTKKKVIDKAARIEFKKGSCNRCREGVLKLINPELIYEEGENIDIEDKLRFLIELKRCYLKGQSEI